MIDLPEGAGLSELLALRGDPMAACSAPWLEHFADIPDDAAPPLAMTGPHPRAVGSYGAECIEWARTELGVTLRWWQALAVTRQLEHDADGALVWREVIESGPRRIGKSVRLRVVAAWRIAHADLIGEKQLSMLVSKDLAVGKEIHRGLWRWAEQPHKKEAGWKVTRLNGGQEVEAPDESRWLLRADTAVYGYDVGYGQVDESWGVDPQSITDGLEPALLERLWPQLHLTSTAHVKATSLMRRRLTAALRDADEDTLLLLWGAHPDADWSLEETWRSASPHWSADRRALMARKYAAALAGIDEPEFDDPDPVRGWAAQYLNVWPLLLDGGKSSTVLPHWNKRTTSATPGRPAALGVAVDLDRVWISVGAASVDDVPHLAPLAVMHDGVAVVLRRRIADDLDFVIGHIARVQAETGCAVVLDLKGPAGSLERRLQDAGVSITPASLDDVCDAAADLYDAVDSGAISHGSYVELDDAVAAAGWRKVGDRKAFARKSGEISMLEAVALAHHQAVLAGRYDVLDSIY